MLDLGPGGGVRGGEIVAEGTPERVAADAASVTGFTPKALLSRVEGPLLERQAAAVVEAVKGKARRKRVAA